MLLLLLLLLRSGCGWDPLPGSAGAPSGRYSEGGVTDRRMDRLTADVNEWQTVCMIDREVLTTQQVVQAARLDGVDGLVGG